MVKDELQVTSTERDECIVVEWEAQLEEKKQSETKLLYPKTRRPC